MFGYKPILGDIKPVKRYKPASQMTDEQKERYHKRLVPFVQETTDLKGARMHQLAISLHELMERELQKK